MHHEGSGSLLVIDNTVIRGMLTDRPGIRFRGVEFPQKRPQRYQTGAYDRDVHFSHPGARVSIQSPPERDELTTIV